MTKLLTTKKVLIISLLFIFLIEAYPIWTRIFGSLWNLLFFLVIFILGCYIIIKLVKEILRLTKERKNLTKQEFYPSIIILITIVYTVFIPGVLNLEERLYGKILLKAYYEGTQTQATFTLRDNGDFVVHHTGVFFYDEYRKGKYKQRKDSLFLNNSQDIHYTLSDTMLIKQGRFWILKNDSLIKTDIRPYFLFAP